MADQDTESLEDELDRLEEVAETEEPKPFMKFLPVVLAAVTLAVFAVVVVIGYSDDEEKPVKIATPVLSPEGLVKIEPDESGGMDIPGQENLAYNQITQDSDDTKVESVLPPAEEPMKPPEGDTEAALPADDGGEMLTQPQEAAPPPAPETATAELPPVTEPTDVPVVPAVPPGSTDAAPATETPPEGATQTAAVTETVVQGASAGTGYRVQIHSVTSRNKAEKAWLLQVKQHPDLFAELTLTVQRAVIKDRGTYYRVQAGPFSKREAADSLCRKLKNLGQDCLVIRP